MKKLILIISVIFTMQNIALANLNNNISINNNLENIFKLSSPSQNMDIKVVINTDDKKTLSESKDKVNNLFIIKIKGKKRQGLKIVIGEEFVFRLNNFKFTS